MAKPQAMVITTRRRWKATENFCLPHSWHSPAIEFYFFLIFGLFLTKMLSEKVLGGKDSGN